ncbi:MAG: dihydrofolate reductase family protein [Alkalimonas sp.]|nr:dihydrofolate reductase family protein [Alkalimonas sp.]
MAHVIHSINTTASGLCHHLDSAIEDDHHQYAIELIGSAELLIFGRNTFDLFMQFWPDAANSNDLPAATIALAKAFERIPKLVVSSRPVELTWHNTYHLQGPDLSKVAAELAAVKGTAVIFGSPSLATSMLSQGLVHEVHVLAQPYIGVEGPRAFSGLQQRVQLSLLAASPLKSGSVLLRYHLT